jgi:hypothetical protein
MWYELWDTESGNLVEDFAEEGEALAAVRQYAALNTPAYPRALALACRSHEGGTTWVASGAELAARAQVAGPEGKSRSA